MPYISKQSSAGKKIQSKNKPAPDLKRLSLQKSFVTLGANTYAQQKAMLSPNKGQSDKVMLSPDVQLNGGGKLTYSGGSGDKIMNQASSRGDVPSAADFPILTGRYYTRGQWLNVLKGIVYNQEIIYKSDGNLQSKKTVNYSDQARLYAAHTLKKEGFNSSADLMQGETSAAVTERDCQEVEPAVQALVTTENILTLGLCPSKNFGAYYHKMVVELDSIGALIELGKGVLKVFISAYAWVGGGKVVQIFYEKAGQMISNWFIAKRVANMYKLSRLARAPTGISASECEIVVEYGGSGYSGMGPWKYVHEGAKIPAKKVLGGISGL